MSEETRQRVLQAVEDLNYIPVRATLQNRHVATNCIGVLFLQDMQGAVGYATFRGMCERARQLDHDLAILLRPQPSWGRPSAEAQFLDRRCDGYVFVGDERPELSEALVGHDIPIVECYSVAPHGGVATLVGDNASGMRQAVRHLAEMGHRRIAHMAGPEDYAEAVLRREGFRAAMKEFVGPDAPELIVQGKTWGDLWGFDQFDDPGLETQPMAEAVLAMKPTAVVCANDMMALALWKMAERKGLRVPEDLSITGMDDIVEASARGLTSVATPFDRIGRNAIDAVVALVNGARFDEVSRVVPVELIHRRSVTRYG